VYTDNACYDDLKANEVEAVDACQSQQKRSKVSLLVGLAASLAITFGVAAVSARFEPGEWYVQLSKPEWTPPGWLFGPVWTFLYASMAVAAWLVWRCGGLRKVRIPLLAYATQLILNGLWTWLFFGSRSIGLALLDIACLFLIIIVTTVLFWKTKLAAGLLLVPYLLWVGFAMVLNYRIWDMN